MSYSVGLSAFRDYVHRTKHLVTSSKWADRAPSMLQGELRQAAVMQKTDVAAIISRVEALAVARAENRPAPVYVVGPPGSGSHWLAAMMADVLPLIDIQEALLPTDLIAQIELLPACEQGLVVDCLHLTYALARYPDATPARVIEAQMLNSGAQVIDQQCYRWDPECFTLHLLRDPRVQATCVAFHMRLLREKYFRGVSDDRYLTGCADSIAKDYLATWRSPVQPNFVCRYEDLEVSASEELVRLATALGHPIEERVASRAVRPPGALSLRDNIVNHKENFFPTSSRGWRAETDGRQKLILHSHLIEVTTTAGYPADDCLGQPLEMRRRQVERRLRFGEVDGLGVLFTRDEFAAREGTWTRFAVAHGDVVVPGGLALKLRVRDSASREAIASLAKLAPDDLDSLCLAGNPVIDDELVETVLASLKGIQELDLARTAVTYRVVPTIAALSCLRGLSVAETELGPGDVSDLRAALGPTGVLGELPSSVNAAVERRRIRGTQGSSVTQKALITGCQRSGTNYIATVLGWAGVASGHESVYGLGGGRPWHGVTVDVSWLAAPLLPVKGVPAAHQVRNPLAVVRSIVGIRFFERSSRFRKFAENVCPRLREEPSPVSAAVRMWCEWTQMAEAHSVTGWRVEDVARETERIAVHTGAPLDRLQRVIEDAPRDINHRRRAPDLDLANVRYELWTEFKAIAAHFGYEVSR